jgi:hypothetical protein
MNCSKSVHFILTKDHTMKLQIIMHHLLQPQRSPPRRFGENGFGKLHPGYPNPCSAVLTGKLYGLGVLVDS